MTTSVLGCIVLINGFPGVGKLAIARSLHSDLVQEGLNVRLVPDHFVTDLAGAVMPRRGNIYRYICADARHTIFTQLKRQFCAASGLIVIMTSCLLDTYRDVEVLEEHLRLAQDCSVPILQVNLTCEPDEHMRRFGNSTQYPEGDPKVTDSKALKKMLRNHELAKFERADCDCWRVQDLLKVFEYDSTGRSTEYSAQKIKSKMWSMRLSKRG